MKSKGPILLVLVLLGIIFLALQYQYTSKKIIVGVEAPDVELTDIQQNRLKLSELRGAVVVVNFWASWCPSCVDEAPSFESLFRTLSGNPQFRLITILYRDDNEKVSRQMREKGYTFPIYSDPGNGAAKRFGITGVPETFIIDKKGILRNKVIGPLQWDSPHMIGTIRSLMNE